MSHVMIDTPPPGALMVKTTSDTAELAPARRQIEAFSRAVGFDERAIGEIGLCVNEAMANVIRHAYRGRDDQPIELSAIYCDSLLIITLRDWGEGLEPGPLPVEKHDPMHPGGLGLICLGRLMDKVTFTPQRPGMLLEMFRRLPPAGTIASSPTLTSAQPLTEQPKENPT